jgi:hypothetical protein
VKEKKEKGCGLDDVCKDVMAHPFHPEKYEAIRRIHEDSSNTINQIALENNSTTIAMPYPISSQKMPGL